MEGDRGDSLFSVAQATCDHAKERHYTQTEFDILKGFELTVTRCINCHKTLALQAKKVGNH
jgi:hypothetical protein